MIKILKEIPKKVVVAVSGGPDSMAALDFISKGPNEVSALFIHHRTDASEIGQNIVRDFCAKRNIDLKEFKIQNEKPKKDSLEEFWRKERYKVFNSIDCDVVTAHHLDDVCETWFFYCAHGIPRTIPYRNKNVIRPFLLNKKEELISWAKNKEVPFIIDNSNEDEKYMRNYIRRKLIPHVGHVNPGIYKTMTKYILIREKNAK